MMKQKILALLLACAMIPALAACSGNASTEQPAANTASDTASDAAEAPAASEETAASA